MSDNTKVVQLAYEAFGRGDVAGLLDLMTDDIEWTAPKVLPQGGHFHGKAGVGQFLQGLGAAWTGLTLDIEAVGEVSPGVVAGVARGTGSLASGTSSGYGAVHLFDLTNGKISRFREYTNLDAVLS